MHNWAVLAGAISQLMSLFLFILILVYYSDQSEWGRQLGHGSLFKW